MDALDNKAVVRRYIELMTRGPVEKLASVVTDNVIGFDGNERISGLGSVVRHARDAQSGCPNLLVDIEQIIEEGEWVAFFGTTSGKQTGNLFGLAPAAREFKVQGMAMARVVNGKIAEIRTGWDTLSFLHQLGGIPTSPLLNRVHTE
jgi:predicted ester cyclase